MRSAYGPRERAVYSALYSGQTVRYCEARRREYSRLVGGHATVLRSLRALDGVHDPSDPDTSLPNSEHAYQAARRARALRPYDTSLQVAALVHDIGKVLFSHGHAAWEVVGDTFVLGEPLPRSAPCYELAPRRVRHPPPAAANRDGCGLDAVVVSWGHDEYMFRVLMQNAHLHTLPQRYCDAIRYHSLYPWHSAGAYRRLMGPGDAETLELVTALNQCDLYSKSDGVVSQGDRAYFDALLASVFPEPLAWRPAQPAAVHAAAAVAVAAL